MDSIMNIDEGVTISALTRGMGLQKALDAAGEILGNPIVMFDISFNLLVNTKNTVTDDPLWNELTASGRFSHEAVDFFYSEGFITEYAKSDVVTFMHSDKLKYDRASAKLFDWDGIQIADIVVVACYRKFVEQDFAMLEVVSEAVSAELCDSKLYQKLSKAFPESIVSDLLEGKVIEGAGTENAIHDLYNGLHSNLYVAVVDLINYDPTLTHLVYFSDLMKSIQKEYKYYVYINNVVIIMSTDKPILVVKRDLKKLNRFFEKYNICVGISDCFQNIFDLPKHYKRALNALNYGVNTRSARRVFKYDDFRLDCFLGTLIGDDDLNELHNPIVPLIKTYDKDRGTMYIDTIYTYLLAGRNTSAASGVLKISRAELRTRLKEITDIFGVDWSDGDMIYSIFTSMRLLENPMA